MNKSANNRWWTFCFEHCKHAILHFRICWFSIECLVMWVRSINRYFSINSSHFQKQPILPYYYFNQYTIQSEFLNNRHNVCTLKGPWLCWSFVLSEKFNCLFFLFFFYSSLDDNFHNITNNCFYNKSMSDWHQNKDTIWVRTKKKKNYK